jgi:hypothetical protein
MASYIVLQPIHPESKKENLGKELEVTAVPMILEVNAQPGLKIQIANRAGLKERLARLKGLKIVSSRHGIRVAQALFADPKLAEKGLGRKSVGRYEEVELVGLNGEREVVNAKIDTGADISSLDINVAERLGLMSDDNILYESNFYNSLGKKKRKVVGITYYLAGRKVKTRISITDRSKVSTKMLVGWLDLKNFAVVGA